jgi:hypothetical protein
MALKEKQPHASVDGAIAEMVVSGTLACSDRENCDLKVDRRAPMTFGNMRELGVHHLIAFCLSEACRHKGAG